MTGKKITFIILFILLHLFGLHPLFANPPKKEYLSNFNLTWNQLPQSWTEGAFTGNGKVGTMIWKNTSNSLRFDIGNTELYNGKSRAPIGKLVLKFKDNILDFNMKLHLQKALVVANLKTLNGSISFETFTDRSSDLQRIKYEINGSETLEFYFESLPTLGSDVLWKSVNKEIKQLNSPDFTQPLIYQKIKNHPKALELKPAIDGKNGTVFYKQIYRGK